MIDIVKLALRYDGRVGEILDNKLGVRLGICDGCLTARSDLRKGMCASCWKREKRAAIEQRERQRRP
ncbi:MAG: hypothetical protein ACRELG_20900 [Gemmataceae bacterium]